MSDEDNKKVEAEVPQLSEKERDIQMFILWVGGASQVEIGAKFGLSQSMVHVISKRDGWKSLKRQMMEKAYSSMVNGLKETSMVIAQALDDDMRKIVKATKDENRMMTESERAHARAYFDRIMKENRLEDGKPTENVSGVHKMVYHIRLPADVKNDEFGVIPPDESVKLIESTPETIEKDKESITLEDIEDYKE